MGARCKLLDKNKEYVRHSSGNDEEFTIFDALLESMIKQKEKKSSFHRLKNTIVSSKKLININLSLRDKPKTSGNKKNNFKKALCKNQNRTIYDDLSENIFNQKEK